MSGSQQLATISLHTISQLEMQLNGLRSKLRSHIVELQASNPLYRQIPYMGAGMEQEDCSIPAAAWQRTAGEAAAEELALGSSIGSHAVLVDAEQLVQLQAAFAELDSMLLDPTALQQHQDSINAAEALLQAKMQCSSWLRALEVCKQLTAEHGDDTQQPQQLAAELAALCAVLSPDRLAVKLQQHSLANSSSSRPAKLPPDFLLQVAAGYASFRTQHLQHSNQLTYADTAALCRQLQEAAECSNGISSLGDSLIGQFQHLQLLYRQSAALTDTISSGTTKCAAVLAPLGLTLLDAAALVAPQDEALMLTLAGCSQADQLVANRAATFVPSSQGGAAAFAYIASGSQQQQQQQGAVEVFQVSSWLLPWQQGLRELQITAGAATGAGCTAGIGGKSSSSIQSQLAAAMALAAACGAAASCCSSAVEQLQGRVAVRTSSAVAREHQQHLAQVQSQRRQAQAELAKLRQSRWAACFWQMQP